MNPHLDQPVVTKGQPISPQHPVFIGAHGRNQTPQVMVDVFERLGWQPASLVAPAAANDTWYPARFMEPIVQNEPYLSYALERVDTLVSELHGLGVPHAHMILMGFSQGACLMAEYAIRHPRRYGGILIYTGGVIGPDGTSWEYPGVFDGTPTLISTCEQDEWVPIQRVRETIDVFRRKGAQVTEKIFTLREHLVCDDEIELTRRLLEQDATGLT